MVRKLFAAAALVFGLSESPRCRLPPSSSSAAATSAGPTRPSAAVTTAATPAPWRQLLRRLLLPALLRVSGK